MIPSSRRLEEIAFLRHGELSEIPYPVLLAALARTHRSVVLEMERKPVQKRIFLDAGAPVDCRSNLVHETFGRFLVGAGKLSDEDFHATLSESFSRDVPLGEILLERKMVDAVELYKLLQQCLARKLLDGFTWQEGSFEIHDELPEVDSALKVKTPQLVLTGILKLTPMKQVMAAIQPLFSEPLAANPNPFFGGEDLQFKGRAGQVIEKLRPRPLRMDELAAQTQLPGDDLGRIIYALALLEVIVPASRLSASPARPAADELLATRRIELPSQPAAGLSGADADHLRSKILESFLSFRRKDAFDLLGVAETASRDEIAAAYLAFAEQFAPWVVERALSIELMEKARTLFLTGAEAYAELRDPERRSELVQRRKRSREEKAKKPAQQKIETDLLDPELQYRRGLEYLQVDNFHKALEFLQFAADVDPQNAVYRAEAAYCRYSLSPTQYRARVLEELEEAVRIDSRCGLACYYLGVVQAKEELADAAEENLRRAIKLMAPDRRPIDALKELNVRRGKR